MEAVFTALLMLVGGLGIVIQLALLVAGITFLFLLVAVLSNL